MANMDTFYLLFQLCQGFQACTAAHPLQLAVGREGVTFSSILTSVVAIEKLVTIEQLTFL
jgi:hypothetical protein